MQKVYLQLLVALCFPLHSATEESALESQLCACLLSSAPDSVTFCWSQEISSGGNT